MIHYHPSIVPSPNPIMPDLLLIEVTQRRYISAAVICIRSMNHTADARLITYFRCSENNIANTVMQYFMEAVSVFSLSSRVHSDYGVENVGVVRFLLYNRGTDHERATLLLAHWFTTRR